TTCPPPISVDYADIQVKSYEENSRERYVCNLGFKRKAGTSSLTQCVLNKTTNTAHWTTPNLKCIRDPSLAHQRPLPPLTGLTTRVTPQTQSSSPPGKGPAVLPPRPDPTVATETAVVPDSRLTPSPSPVTGVNSHPSSPTRTRARSPELTASPALKAPGAHPHGSGRTTVVISTSVIAVLCGMCAVSFLAWYLKSRCTSRSRGLEMDAAEAMPMTARTGGREEDMGTY
uniref:Interleukin-15 receptor subunit alpha n=2 Tax=Jaculus jaculus TaxID=51337 RepID=A0A8C5NWR5_JACJA